MSKRMLFVFIGLVLFFGRAGPLYMLNQTEVAEVKREQDPFTRNVSVSQQGENASSQQGSGIRIPAEHMASYLFGNLMGGLKQVAVTSLWVKYGRLKEEERYQEAVALLQILQILQPEREQVWSFLARDVAFEISNSQPNLQTEWENVKRALRILRDGDQRMGGSIRLNSEMGWIHGIRIPQEPYMLNQSWNESGATPSARKTNYRRAVESYQRGWTLAKERGQVQETRYTQKFGFMINYTFYDIVMLLHFGQHERALERVPEARRLTRKWVDAYPDNRRVPGPFVVRLRSYQDLPELIKADRRLESVPWSTEEERTNNRKQKVERTKQFLEAWRVFFHRYQGALAEEAARHVLRQSFELLYYVTRDIEQYHRKGDEEALNRAERLLEEVLLPRIQRLTASGSNVGGGYIEQARTDLGMFWQEMKENYQLQATIFTSDDRQTRTRARRDLESVYTSLLDLYNSDHRGFHMKWLKKELDRLESENLLNF